MLQKDRYIPAPGSIAVSVFANVYAKHAYPYDLARFIAMVTGAAPNRYRADIERLRAIDRDICPDEYKAIKRDLCAFTLSCALPDGAPRSAAPARGNGILCVDIDGKDNPGITDWPGVRTALGGLDAAYLSALSCGGKGVFVLLAVDPDIDHRRTFEAARRFFREQLALIIDNACADINRLRTITYDPGAVAKQPTALFIPLAAPVSSQRPVPTSTPVDHDEFTRIRAAVRLWVQRRLPLDDFTDWTKAAAALRHLPDGADLFDQVSQFAANYKGRSDCDRKIHYVDHMRKINPGSFIHLCDKYGITAADIDTERRKADAEAAKQQRPPPERRKIEAEAATTPAAIVRGYDCYDLLAGVYTFMQPTASDIEILNPNFAPPTCAPF